MERARSGQTSIEMLMIVAFVVLVATIAIIMASGVVSSAANSVANVTIIPK